jgi:PKD repeat protein
MWWTEWSSRSTSVPVDIEYADDIDRIYIDQQQDGGHWNYLGTYVFDTNGGTVTVVAEEPAPTSYCADAVKFNYIQTNDPPTATIDSISPNPADVNQMVTFVGYGTDTDGNIVAYNWQSSRDGNLSNDASFSTDTLSAGEHEITFKVKDDENSWSEAATENLIIVGNVFPVAYIDSIAPNPAGVNDVVTFIGHGEDADGNIAEYSWVSSIDGNLSDINSFATSELSTGEHEITFKVKDDDNAWSEVVTENLFVGNIAPSAYIDSITPSPATVNDVVTFVGHGEDADGSITGCNWVSSIDGPLSDVNSFTTSELSTGEHEISFEVYDNEGATSAPVTATLNIHLPVTELIIDNGDAETYYTGTWSVSGGTEPYGPNSLWSRDGSSYTWQFTPTVSGYYELSMWWTQWPSRTTEAPVEIPHADGTDTVYCNQRQNGGQWNKLGDYNFEAGNSYNITITAVTGTSSTCADAVKFVKIDEPGPPVADFYADRVRGGVPFTIQFNNQSIGQITEYFWDFGDGQTSSQRSPSHTYTTAGVHSVSLTINGPLGTDEKIRYSYIDIKPSNTENIYLFDGYSGDPGFIPQTTAMLRNIGAVESGNVWIYSPDNSNMTYYIYTVHSPAAAIAALEEEDAHIIIEGHANFGFGLTFAEPYEIWQQKIYDVYFVDDDRFVNYSTDMVSTKVDGMKYGQAYPNWEPVFKDGSSAIMPYNFGDPRGNPPYNYYLTYQILGDPETYKIELSSGKYLERFPDSGAPAWFSADGTPPDPIENPEYFITNPDEAYNRFDSIGEWVIKKVPAGGYTGDEGYFGYNYQAQWPGNGSKVATWTMVLKHTGLYMVLATWYPDPNNATNAPYIINHTGGPTVVQVDQSQTAMLNPLGVFHFTAGSQTVQLSDLANGQVVADVVALMPLDDPSQILQAEFTAETTQGTAPLTVQFEDRSMYYSSSLTGDVNEWYWDFGDGNTSTLEDPNHTYTSPGAYTVSLRIVDSAGIEDTEVKTDFIGVGVEPPIQAEFYASRRQGTQKTFVEFTDQSSGALIGWNWDFGDGNTSNEQNPSHMYNTPGTYTVSLTVSGPSGSDTETEENYIYNFIGVSYTDNTFKTKPHFYSGSGAVFGKVICQTGDVKVQEEDLGYTRMFHGACNSFTYFAENFRRGIMYGKITDVKVEIYTGTYYLEYYLKGYSDQDILEYVNSIENNHEFYDFNLKPPSLR